MKKKIIIKEDNYKIFEVSGYSIQDLINIIDEKFNVKPQKILNNKRKKENGNIP